MFCCMFLTSRSKEEEELEKYLDEETVRSMERQRKQRQEMEESKLLRERNKTSLIQVRRDTC